MLAVSEITLQRGFDQVAEGETAAAISTLDTATALRIGDPDADMLAAQVLAQPANAGDLDAALDADARFHQIAIAASGNRAAAAVIAQFEPVLLRAERLRFASHEGAESAARHAMPRSESRPSK